MKKSVGFVFLFSLVVFATQLVHAGEKVYKLNGIIDQITKDSFSVQSDKGLLEFDRGDSDSQLPKNAKVGDNVTIWYTVDMEKIAIRKGAHSPKQEPGQLGPDQQRIILDDRVFYSAENSKEKSKNNHNNS